MESKNRTIIKKPSAVIQAIPQDENVPVTNLPKTPKTLSLIQRKLWNLLLYNAYSDLTTKDVHHIRIRDVCRALNINDVPLLKESITGLGRTVVEFNFFKTRDKAVWKWSTLLSGGEIDADMMTYSYSHILREHLNNPHTYTRLNLAIQYRMTSKYSLALYELVCDHIIYETGKGFTPYLDINDLKKYLGCHGEKAYQNFREFNRTILKRSIGEINIKSDINVKLSFKKKGKYVSSVQFHAEFRKDKGKFLGEIFKPQQALLAIPSSETKKRLVSEYGLTDSQAAELTGLFSDDVINERLVYVTSQINTGKVRSPAAFTYSAIKEGYKEGENERQEHPKHPKPSLPPIQPGMRIDIGQGRIYIVEDTMSIYTRDRYSIPEGAIRQGIYDGKFKIIRGK